MTSLRHFFTFRSVFQTWLAVLCACELAQATEAGKERLWVNAGFYSVHFDQSAGLRDPNPGLGLEYSLSPNWSLTAGRYINSDNQYSSYLGAYYQPWRFARAKWGAAIGAFNGYPKAFDGGWFPAVVPTATWEGERWGLNVALVPALKDRLHGAVSFQLKYRVPAAW